jgi:hypothetical protein
LIILVRNPETITQQIDYWQISARLAVRDRKRFQHHPGRLGSCLELEEQTRLGDSRLGNRGHYLPRQSQTTKAISLMRINREAPCRSGAETDARVRLVQFSNVPVACIG